MRNDLVSVERSFLPEVLYEDDHLIALNKPSGILSIPGRHEPNVPSLSKMLREKYGAIFIVHRLDRETSGVILFAKDADTHRKLSIQFESRRTRKTYFAVVDGIVAEERLFISLPLAQDAKRPGCMCIDMDNGKKSETEIAVRKRFINASVIDVFPHTGRQHQIRAHLAAIGHPLLVDNLYGARDALYLSSLKREYKSSGKEKPLIARLTLHAREISFAHPQTEEVSHIVAPLPGDLTILLRQLEKWER